MMKIKTISFLLVCGLLFACQENTQEAQTEAEPVAEKVSFHGAKIDAADAIAVQELSGIMEKQGPQDQIKLEGKIEETCQNKGCWMTMKLANGEDMRIKFKDYAFFVPKDSPGKTAVIEGKAFYDTIPVDELRHYAVDGGMSEAEAAEKYQEDELAINFEATGVIITEEEGK
ncbi:MAG: DUF4920 domain-containing protein [Bacteroidota bacterium]